MGEAADLQAQLTEARDDLANAVCTCGHRAEWHSALIGCNAEDYTADAKPCDCRCDWLDAIMPTLAALVSAHVAQVREGLAEEIEARMGRDADYDDGMEDAARIVRPSVGPREQRSDFAGDGKSEGHTDSQSRIGAGGGAATILDDLHALAKGSSALSRYVVGYFCHKGSGHFDMYGDPDAEFACGSAPIYLDREDAIWFETHGLLPEGRWEEALVEGSPTWNQTSASSFSGPSEASCSPKTAATFTTSSTGSAISPESSGQTETSSTGGRRPTSGASEFDAALRPAPAVDEEAGA